MGKCFAHDCGQCSERKVSIVFPSPWLPRHGINVTSTCWSHYSAEYGQTPSYMTILSLVTMKLHLSH